MTGGSELRFAEIRARAESVALGVCASHAKCESRETSCNEFPCWWTEELARDVLALVEVAEAALRMNKKEREALFHHVESKGGSA